MKKITALLLMLSLCLAMLAACGEDKAETTNGGETNKPAESQPVQDTNPPAPVDPAEEAVAVADNFMAAYAKFDFETAAQYIDDASFLENPAIGMLADPDQLLQMISESMGIPEEASVYLKHFNSGFVTMVERLKSAMTCERIAYDLVDGNYEVVFKTATPNIESFSAALELLSNAFNEDTVVEIATTLMENGTLTTESTEEEAIDAVCKFIGEQFTAAISEAELSTVEDEQTVVVKNVDGKWLVNAEALLGE